MTSSEFISATTEDVDVTAVIRQRVNELLKDRTEISNKEFALAIGQQESWVSEFRRGRRHANQIRVVARMARFFRVSVAYLIGETKDDEPLDGETALLLAAWEQLDDKDDREMTLGLLQQVRDKALKGRGRTGAPPTDKSDDAPPRRTPRTPPTDAPPPKRKLR